MPKTASLVTTLVAAKSTILEESLVLSLVENFRALGGRLLHHHWHAPQRAADIFCAGLDADLLRKTLAAAVGARPIDMLIQPTVTRRKALLLADMESTIIEQEMLDELAGELGLREKVSDITRRAMNGELDFAAALNERVALMANQPESLLDTVASRITLMPGAAELVATFKRHGGQCWLVSGGFTRFAAGVGAMLGFDRVFANELILQNGQIVGKVKEPILDRDSKRQLLLQACQELEYSLEQCLVVGDGANDIPMLNGCNDGGGLGVAFHAKPKVRELVLNQVNHGDLSVLAYAQG